jgi:hypothetical protein
VIYIRTQQASKRRRSKDNFAPNITEAPRTAGRRPSGVHSFQEKMALYVLVLLGLLAGAAGQNTKSCSVFGMSRICAAHPIQCSTNCDPKKLCAEPCVKAMVACASDPTLGYYLGKTQVDSIKQMSTTCSHPPSLPAGHGRPGDGTCNLMDLAKCDAQSAQIHCWHIQILTAYRTGSIRATLEDQMRFTSHERAVGVR